MDNTITERQRRYRDRLYKAGFKHLIVWVKRKEGRIPKKISKTEFVRQMKILTDGINDVEKTRLYNILLKIANGRKEEVKLRKKK